MKKIPQEICDTLFNYLEKLSITLHKGKSSRAKTFGTHRSMSLGIVRNRHNMKYGLSAKTKQLPDLYEMLLDIYNKYFFDEEIENPTTITINKNLVCPPHKDKYNKSSSVIFSIGDYEGCNLIIQKPDGDEEINTFRNPVMFEGSKYTHYNTPLISGTKYSFIFFSVCLPEALFCQDKMPEALFCQDKMPEALLLSKDII